MSSVATAICLKDAYKVELSGAGAEGLAAWPMLARRSLVSTSTSTISSTRRGNLVAKAEQKSRMIPPTIIAEEFMPQLPKTLSGEAERDWYTDMFIPPNAVDLELKSLRRLPGSNILLAPVACDFRVKQAVFVKASTKVSQCPSDGLPEFALVGRSNVGKSSLINTLVQRKEFAETSKKPGKTQVINHYLINKSWYLVDLPGYGFANVPTNVSSSWNTFTKDFFLRSDSLVAVMLLVDSSVPPQPTDLDCASWLGRNKVPLTIVFTKCDKSKPKKLDGHTREFLRLLRKSYDQMPPWVMTSCVTSQGRDELLTHIKQLRDYWSS